MELIKQEDFTHAGKTYEIRVYREGIPPLCRYDVITFLDNEPANGFTYSVNFFIRKNLYEVWGQDVIQDSIDCAKNDIKEDRWNKYLEAVKIVRQRKQTT